MNDVPEVQTITYTRKKKAINKQPVTFKIDKGLLQQLNEYADKEKRKKVDIVEEALREYFKRGV